MVFQQDLVLDDVRAKYPDLAPAADEAEEGFYKSWAAVDLQDMMTTDIQLELQNNRRLLLQALDVLPLRRPAAEYFLELVRSRADARFRPEMKRYLLGRRYRDDLPAELNAGFTRSFTIVRKRAGLRSAVRVNLPYSWGTDWPLKTSSDGLNSVTIFQHNGFEFVISTRTDYMITPGLPVINETTIAGLVPRGRSLSEWGTIAAQNMEGYWIEFPEGPLKSTRLYTFNFDSFSLELRCTASRATPKDRADLSRVCDAISAQLSV
ncbi:hypothetical protein [Halioglobus sp. HI00S01]|uniref:hypothetical protein n=1 Tax=Halioglobus sp. HI00S01 TaxID=1822214 RepID=UPI0012E7BF6B|nr:hypothetical protein [Halioglobus sp. HI00S01]